MNRFFLLLLSQVMVSLMAASAFAGSYIAQRIAYNVDFQSTTDVSSALGSVTKDMHSVSILGSCVDARSKIFFGYTVPLQSTQDCEKAAAIKTSAGDRLSAEYTVYSEANQVLASRFRISYLQQGMLVSALSKATPDTPVILILDDESILKKVISVGR